MMVISKLVKTELTSICLAALTDFLRSTRGANIFGAKATVTEPKPNTLQVRASDGRYFEVIIKETF
jgi:hypothetical protein